MLHAAVTLHPSLADALLLPTSLLDSSHPDSNKVQIAPVQSCAHAFDQLASLLAPALGC